MWNAFLATAFLFGHRRLAFILFVAGDRFYDHSFFLLFGQFGREWEGRFLGGGLILVVAVVHVVVPFVLLLVLGAILASPQLGGLSTSHLVKLTGVKAIGSLRKEGVFTGVLCLGFTLMIMAEAK